MKDHHEVTSSVSFGSAGTIRRDLRLSPLSQGGSGMPLEKREIDDSGSAVSNGKVTIGDLGWEAPIEAGRSSFQGVPPGTWEVTARAVGFAPSASLIDVPALAGRATLQMNRLPQLLDSVVVSGTRPQGNAATLIDIRERLKSANGTLITSDNLSVRNSTQAGDANRMATGFRWKGPTKISARPYVTSGGALRDCESASTADAIRRDGEKEVAIYLNGNRVPGGLQALNQMVLPKDILAIEAYSDVVSAPFIWRKNDTCAVVAIWTKR
jgi:hypothetical protein